MPVVSAVVRKKAEMVGATAWLETLPDLVETLCRDWGISVGRAYADSTEAYVAEAVTPDGGLAVLKLLVPRADAASHEIAALRLADGDGCVRLLRADADRQALLLERLGPSMHSLGVDLHQRHRILADLARRMWRPAVDAGLPTGAEKATSLVSFIQDLWSSLGHPCQERTVEHAIICAERRHAAYDPARAVLAHADVHQWNALRAGDGFALVDPDGLFVEPEYDLGVIMREDPLELLRDGPHARARFLAARTGCDPRAVWDWGVVERISTGLLAASIGLQPAGRQMLRVADRIAAEPAGRRDEVI